jgi:glucokinase
MSPVFLVGDIGGTNSRLALYSAGSCLKQQHYPTLPSLSLFDHISDFLAQCSIHIDMICLAVAGPVENGTVVFTNVGWHLNAQEIAQAFACHCELINDFYAQAMAVSITKTSQLKHITGPQSLNPHHPWGVLGVGTGLGEALLIPSSMSLESIDPYHLIVVPTEGGHCRFAPKNIKEFELLCFLQEKYGEHISVERVLSGQGLVDLYAFLSGGLIQTPTYITQSAIQNTDQIAKHTLDLFISCYGDEAANLCLKSKSKAIFLSGGISPKISSLLEPNFSHAFLNKGRYQSLLTQTSLYLVTEPEPGLLGAYAYAQCVYAKKLGKC